MLGLLETWKRVAFAAALIALAACSEGLAGPKPQLAAPSADADPPPVDPEILCRDQLATEVTLHGERFSPVPIDVPHAPKLALPNIVLRRGHELDGRAVSDPAQVLFSGDPDADTTNALRTDGEPRVLWSGQSELRFIVDQELTLAADGEPGMLEPGVWDVRVENANGEAVESPQALAVVDKPQVTTHTPGIVCLEQRAVEIALTGRSFLRSEALPPVLEVEGVEGTFELALADCTAIEHAGLDAELCTGATVELPEGSVPVGLSALTVRNPETAACGSTEDVALRVVPAPALDRVVDPLACVAQGERGFVLEGRDFLRIDGEYPRVAIGDRDFAVQSADGCEALQTQGHEVERCSSLVVAVAEDALDPGLYDVLIVNPEPAGCEGSATGVLRIAPPPALAAVEPPLVCVDDAERSVTVRGSDFLVVAGAPPSVSVDGEALAAGAIAPDDCEDLEVDGLDVQRCATLVLTLAQGGVDVGMPEIAVANPDPAGCSDRRADLLTVAPGPQIASAEPALLCTADGSKMIAVSGTGFLKVGDALPAVSVGGSAVASVVGVDGCTAISVDGLDVESCTEITVTVAQGALEAGRPLVEVINPDPAGCAAASGEVLTVPPTLAIAGLMPVNVCQNTESTAFPVTLAGDGFLQVGSDLPSLALGSTSLSPSSLSGCTELEVAGASDVASCTQIDATLNLTTAETGTVGALPITVTNGHAPACALSAMTVLNVVAPPAISAVDIAGAPVDDAVCSDLAFTLVITGSGFVEGTTVTLVSDDDEEQASSVVIDGPTQLTATFADGLLYDAGDPTFDLVVASAEGCAGAPLVDAIEVNPSPLVFFVDPPVVYDAISIDITVFTAGLSVSSALDTLELIDASETATELTVVDNSKLNRIVARVPADAFAPGDYVVRVTSVLGCSGELAGGLSVTDTVDDTLLASIAPSFVSPDDPTAVTVTGSGLSGVPRLYLTPASGSGTATALRAVEVLDPTRLTAIIPALGSASAGAYDLVLVTADGEVDVLEDAVTVTADPPPVVANVVPASLPASATGTVTIEGSGFDAAGVTVELDCLSGGTRTTIAGTEGAVSGDGTSVDVTFAISVGEGSICLVRLVNGDGALSEYSAFSVTNASLNLSPWSDGTPMTVGRRSPALAAGRPTQTSRFLYAIGGDSGTPGDPLSRGSVLTSVESASVDVFGVMGGWSLQRNDLSAAVIGGTPASAARTQAGVARIGRFVYLTGGHDGAAASSTLLRAEVLDPLAGPEIVDLDARLGELESGGVGLDGGFYYYRVAAVFPGDDASNPGGESLPGELLPVQLPERPEKIWLSLTWQEVPGAHGYRVYRSPQAGDGASELELLAELTCGTMPNDLCDCGADPDQCSFTDDDSAGTTAGTPLPRGSLGVWHAVDGARCADPDCALGTAREGLVTVAARDRTEADASTDTFYLYALGGRDAGGAYLASYEVATVTIDLATGGQTVSDWAAGSDTLLSPRADLGAWVMSAENSSGIRGSGSPDAVWIYVGGGRTTGGASDGSVEAGLVAAGGDLGTFADTDDMPGSLVGFGAGASNDQLYTFGGQTAASGSSAELCSGGGGCAALPDLQPGAWNALGAAQTDRMFTGYTQESAFFFLAGGHDGVSTLASTEQTVQ